MVDGTLPAVKSGVRIRSVALPVEHGGWSLLFEPILLGLLLAPSFAGLLVSLAATAAFLARHPFKLAMTDWRRQRVGRRTRVAQRFALAYAVVAIISLSLALTTVGRSFLLPLLFAAPLALVQLSYDSFGRSRALLAELAGSIATGALATAIAICGGWPRGLAFALWILVAARSVPTILYLRARLRLLRHKPASMQVAMGVQFLGLLVVVGVAWSGHAPWLAVLAMSVLLVRAYLGLSSSRRLTPQRLGVSELLFGAMNVAAVSLGYTLHW